MKKILFLVPLVFCSQSLFAKTFKGIIDAGHGGVDKGAVRSGINESDITLNVARDLAKLIRRDKDFAVILTRNSDNKKTLVQRARTAIQNKGDLFVSIHVNSSLDPRAFGGEIYFQNQLPPDQEAMFLANKENPKTISAAGLNWPRRELSIEKGTPKDVTNILKDLQRNERIRLSGKLSETLSENWGFDKSKRKRHIRQAPFYVISHVNMPSVLVELGFLTHKTEAQRLTNRKHQRRMARDLFKGLRKFKVMLDKHYADL